MKKFFDWESLPIVLMFVIVFAVLGIFTNVLHTQLSEEIPVVERHDIPDYKPTKKPVTEVIKVEEEKAFHYSDEEIVAMVVHAEAGNQPMIGRVAVASVVLNRCDYWGLTVESVVYAENQFTIADTYTEDDMRAVVIAMSNRDLFPDNLLYFRAGDYHKFGEHWEHIGDHYFSLAEEKEN